MGRPSDNKARVIRGSPIARKPQAPEPPQAFPTPRQMAVRIRHAGMERDPQILISIEMLRSLTEAENATLEEKLDLVRQNFITVRRLSERTPLERQLKRDLMKALEELCCLLEQRLVEALVVFEPPPPVRPTPSFD